MACNAYHTEPFDPFNPFGNKQEIPLPGSVPAAAHVSHSEIQDDEEFEDFDLGTGTKVKGDTRRPQRKVKNKKDPAAAVAAVPKAAAAPKVPAKPKQHICKSVSNLHSYSFNTHSILIR